MQGTVRPTSRGNPASETYNINMHAYGGETLFTLEIQVGHIVFVHPPSTTLRGDGNIVIAKQKNGRLETCTHTLNVAAVTRMPRLEERRKQF